jgi:hypothetical protein
MASKSHQTPHNIQQALHFINMCLLTHSWELNEAQLPTSAYDYDDNMSSEHRICFCNMLGIEKAACGMALQSSQILVQLHIFELDVFCSVLLSFLPSLKFLHEEVILLLTHFTKQIRNLAFFRRCLISANEHNCVCLWEKATLQFLNLCIWSSKSDQAWVVLKKFLFAVRIIGLLLGRFSQYLDKYLEASAVIVPPKPIQDTYSIQACHIKLNRLI